MYFLVIKVSKQLPYFDKQLDGIVGSELTALSFNNYALSAISHGPDHNPEFQWTSRKLLVATFPETDIISDNSSFESIPSFHVSLPGLVGKKV